MIEKAKAVKSADELLEIIKANGVEITAEEAAAYFEQINANSLDDDLLDRVSGGWLILQGTTKKADPIEPASSTKSQCS